MTVGSDHGTGLAGRLVVGLAGPLPTAAEERWLRRYAPAGVILFRRNIVAASQLRALTQRLRELLPPGGEIVVDHEGGPVSVAEAAVGRPPAAFALGRIDDPDLTREVHRETARRLAACGIDRVLAPVADVLTAADNPVIGARAFGREVALVTRHVAAAVTGLREGGVRCCLKHWPGHGGTTVDPHDRELVTAGETVDPAPFLAGMAAGADAVLVGHLPVAGSRRPATLEHAVVDALASLFPVRPTIWCDDVSMGALRAFLTDLLPPDLRRSRGLLPPQRLPRSWFAEIAAGGCDRLPIRGVPWDAFPLPEQKGPAADRAYRVWPAAAAAGTFVDQPPVWAAVRKAVAGEPWPEANGQLLWWDVCPGHRWAAAVDEDLPRRGGWQGEVYRWPAEQCAGEVDALLVTSPLPLPLPLPRHSVGSRPPTRWQDLLAVRGRAVVAGHPALADQLRSQLPSGWSLTALADAHPWDLAPLWRDRAAFG